MVCYNGRRHDRDRSSLGRAKETLRHVKGITGILVVIVAHIAMIIAMIDGVLTGSSPLSDVVELLGRTGG